MKTIFVINPRAGQGKNIESFVSQVKETALKTGKDVFIYMTKAVGDAKRFVKEYCENNGAARFISCGGDGTLNEVANAALGFDGAEVGVVPLGTGNDFVRNFGADFKNIEYQITGESVKCDIIKYTTELSGEQKEGYCVNMFNIGFDANVASLASKLKEKPFISGSFAYFGSIIINLIKKKGANIKIEIDGEEVGKGEFLLSSVANGCYCGGGILSNPLADICDGRININIIRNVSRLKFIGLLPLYMKGTFLEKKGIEKIISSVKCRKVMIEPLEGKIEMSCDGEIITAGKTNFEILEKKLSFVVPGMPREETKELLTVGGEKK